MGAIVAAKKKAVEVYLLEKTDLRNNNKSYLKRIEKKSLYFTFKRRKGLKFSEKQAIELEQSGNKHQRIKKEYRYEAVRV